MKGDVKSIEILAKILASPFLFWLFFINLLYSRGNQTPKR